MIFFMQSLYFHWANITYGEIQYLYDRILINNIEVFFAYFERKELSYIMMHNWKNYVSIKTENIKLLKRYLSIVQNDQ